MIFIIRFVKTNDGYEIVINGKLVCFTVDLDHATASFDYYLQKYEVFEE